MRQLKISNQTTDRSSISVEKYLNDVSKIALLTPEEETELTALIHATGDERAKTRLINANLRFVISVAKQYQGSGLTLEDLIAVGNMGLMKAADRFDPTRGFKFISFAVWWIRQMILQEIANTGRTIYQPSNRTGKWGQVRKAMRELEQILEREPTVEEIAEHMEQKVDFVKDIMETQGQTTSYDMPINLDGSPDTILSLMEDTSSLMPDSYAIHGETQHRLVIEMSKHLTQRQLQAVTWYYGIGCMPKSLVEIAEEHGGITREGARQTLEAGMKRLRNRKDLFAELFYNA
jgi:RNA polymerase primary sigma factor